MSKQIGSTWHKWDLHYHTPKSYDYHNKSKTVTELVNELVNANVSGVIVQTIMLSISILLQHCKRRQIVE